MSCPHFKKGPGDTARSGICQARSEKTMIPCIDDVRTLCDSEQFDECPFYLDYIGSCTKESFRNLIAVIEPADAIKH